MGFGSWHLCSNDTGYERAPRLASPAQELPVERGKGQMAGPFEALAVVMHLASRLTDEQDATASRKSMAFGIAPSLAQGTSTARRP